jgi:hypothetical protein
MYFTIIRGAPVDEMFVSHVPAEVEAAMIISM